MGSSSLSYGGPSKVLRLARCRGNHFGEGLTKAKFTDRPRRRPQDLFGGCLFQNRLGDLAVVLQMPHSRDVLAPEFGMVCAHCFQWLHLAVGDGAHEAYDVELAFRQIDLSSEQGDAGAILL